jgi:uncharacterized protein
MTRAVPLVEGARLAQLAAAAVGARLRGRDPLAEPMADLIADFAADGVAAPGASFVTLERRGALRGCVGTLEPSRPLYYDVVRNAVRAMNDPRLPAVTAADWPELDVKVSVLTPETPVPAATRAELLAALRPGVDGLVLTGGPRRATFLPAVWAKLPEPADFVDALLRKGGWPAGEWPAELAAARYTSEEFHDAAPREPLVME